MKKLKILIFVFTLFLLGLQKCTFLNSNNDTKIISQELLYDSLFKKKKIFDVNLYTTLIFNSDRDSNNNFTHFFAIIKKDTFPLNPIVNYKDRTCENGSYKIKFRSQINFSSLNYVNDSLTKIILWNCKIINKDGEEIFKDKTFEFKSLIKFHKIKKDAIKYE
jgi:hypothetical protein